MPVAVPGLEHREAAVAQAGPILLDSIKKMSVKDAKDILTRIKEEAKNVAKSRRDMITPKPMEVDQVEAGEEYYDEEGTNQEDEHEVYYVGKGSNHGTAKGAKGKGKGKGAKKGKARDTSPNAYEKMPRRRDGNGEKPKG